VWFHGEYEKSKDSRIVWSRLAPGAAAWTAPQVAFDEPGLAEGNPALWVREDGTLFLFFVTIVKDAWHEARPRLIRSTDLGRTWSAPVNLTDENCFMLRHRPVRLKTGALLLPAYHECFAEPVFFRSDDDFATWTIGRQYEDADYLMDHVGQIQPALLIRPDGSLLSANRNGSSQRRMTHMESRDEGVTWTPSVPTELPNPGASVDHARLLDGHVVTVFDNDPYARFPLAAALSTDEGATIAKIRHLNEECDRDSCAYAYPSVMQGRRDGTIWVTYTHNRETIGWVHFNEAWLAQGTARAKVTCLEGEACAGGQCGGNSLTACE
jgi:predicted neuraminidase